MTPQPDNDGNGRVTTALLAQKLDILIAQFDRIEAKINEMDDARHDSDVKRAEILAAVENNKKEIDKHNERLEDVEQCVRDMKPWTKGLAFVVTSLGAAIVYLIWQLIIGAQHLVP